jgi:tRNA A22 N-methylase
VFYNEVNYKLLKKETEMITKEQIKSKIQSIDKEKVANIADKAANVTVVVLASIGAVTVCTIAAGMIEKARDPEAFEAARTEELDLLTLHTL